MANPSPFAVEAVGALQATVYSGLATLLPGLIAAFIVSLALRQFGVNPDIRKAAAGLTFVAFALLLNPFSGSRA